jgi:hypothetical protein
VEVKVEVEEDLLFCAALATLVKCFEMSRLYQGNRRSILSKGENLEDFRWDRIERSRSF